MCWTSVWPAMPGRGSEASWLGSRCPPCRYRKESGWDARRTTLLGQGAMCAKRLDLQGRTCVITGATSGLGEVAAGNAPQALRPILTGRRRGRVWRRYDDVPCKACPFEQADEEPGDVELPPAPAVAGRTRIGVMIVVPALAGREYPDEDVVLAVVVGVIAAVAPQMGE